MTAPIHDFIKHTIGGGWGAETSGPDDQPVRIIRGADFPDVQLRDVSNLPLRYEPVSKISRRALRSGDIVLETSGGTANRPTGRTVLITAGMVANATATLIPASFCRLVRIDETMYSPEFVYYALQCLYDDGGTWEYQNQSTGISNFQFEVFRKRYRLPSIDREDQNLIAEVLGALDDKIAVNTGLARKADDLASARFSQEIRQVPKSSLTFSDLAKVSGGGTPSTKIPNYWGGNVEWATPTDITALSGPYLEATSRRISAEGLRACSSELFQPGAILMTSRATIGAFAIAQVPTAVNQGFIVVEPHDVALRYWLFHEMRSRVDEFVAYANGATFLELSRGNFKSFLVRLADLDVMAQFGREAKALHSSARAALRENAQLAATRDALIPQLMSGKLRVKDAEKVLENVL